MGPYRPLPCGTSAWVSAVQGVPLQLQEIGKHSTLSSPLGCSWGAAGRGLIRTLLRVAWPCFDKIRKRDVYHLQPFRLGNWPSADCTGMPQWLWFLHQFLPLHENMDATEQDDL